MISLFGSLNEPEKKAGIFDRMKQAVSRTREAMNDRLDSVLALTRTVDESTFDDLETVLLASDLGVTTTTEILDRLRQQALKRNVQDAAELKQLLKAELKNVLDGIEDSTGSPRLVSGTEVIMMVGVNGTGKTTTAGKLAAYFTNPSALQGGYGGGQGNSANPLGGYRSPQDNSEPGQQKSRSVLLCAADTFRAAAIEQLEVWAARSGVEIIKTRQGGDPSAALFDALQAAKARNIGILIVDTAGRLHTKSNLMAELDKMRRTCQRFIPAAPHQTLLVMDATTGQNGLQQARLFTESAGVTGIVLTKLDGTAKGGIVVAIARELGLPVRFVGIGEKMEDILPFDSTAFVESLLGS